MIFKTRKRAVVSIVFFGIVLAIGLPAIRAAREAARRVLLRNGDPVKDMALVRSILDELPVISLEDRLAYEAQRPISDDAKPVPLSRRSERLIRQSEEAWASAPRLAMLRELHDAEYIEFVEANGFGVGRRQVRKPDQSAVILPELAWIPPPRAINPAEPPTAIQNPTSAISDSESFPDLELAHLHQQGSGDFADPNRLGLVTKPRRVSGFQSHALSRDPNSLALEHLAEWQVSRTELVGLLKFAEPRVYESHVLPRMDYLNSNSTRQLDTFEQDSLRQLRDGEEIVIEQELNHIRMVGAIRAAKQCLDCHSVRRGELLGAFSYLLDRKQPIRLPKIEGEPVSMARRRSNDS